MFQFLIILLLLGFIVLVGILLSVFGFFRTLLRGPRQYDQSQGQQGWPGSTHQQRRSEQGSNSTSNQQGSAYNAPNSNNGGKIISDQEGEYVDYEEIK